MVLAKNGYTPKWCLVVARDDAGVYLFCFSPGELFLVPETGFLRNNFSLNRMKNPARDRYTTKEM